MTDAGYSSEYEVHLTHRNGVQIVTNELSLHLLDEMRARSISLSETAAIMNLPKSTIQGNLGKLQRMGVIVQDVCEDDARSAVYRIVGRLLFRSRTESDWQRYARAASVACIMTNGRCERLRNRRQQQHKQVPRIQYRQGGHLHQGGRQDLQHPHPC